MSKNKHLGSSFESFLREEGIFEEVDLNVRKRILVEQIRALMKRRRVTPTVLASRMSTSRTAVNRLLNAEEGMTFDGLERATRALGAELVVKVINRAIHTVTTRKSKTARPHKIRRARGALSSPSS